MNKVADAALPKIFTVLPDEIRNMHPHGQWVFDQAGLVLNFACDIVDDHFPDIEPWARKLVEFLASDEPYMEFESPHAPGVVYLHRHAAYKIITTQPAWSLKVMARTRPGGPTLMDSQTGLPVISKLRN
jgi:hypothetical protein